MRLTSSRAYTRSVPVPKMPPGLVELMEGLTKDVLKNNPTNVYEFCANHMEKLLEIRDGPSSKKQLTLEQKIAKAQEKVRQRAMERQQRFDRSIALIQSDIKNYPKNDNSDEENQNSPEKEPMPNLRAPVHHDQDLSLASEVEISHETFTDNSLTPRDSNIDEHDDTGGSKSSTLSSVSKSTVIDRANDAEKEETVDRTEAYKIEYDNASEPVQEGDIDNHSGDKTSDKENIESTSESTSVIEKIKIESPIKDSLKPAKEDLAPHIIDEIHGAISDNLTEIFEESNTVIQKGNEYTVELRSLEIVNTIMEEDDKDMADIGDQGCDSVAESESFNIEMAMFIDQGSTVQNTDNNITYKTPNELPSASNFNDAKSYVPMDATVIENNTELIQDTAQPDSVCNKTNIVADISYMACAQDSDVNDTTAVQSIIVETSDEHEPQIIGQDTFATAHVIEDPTSLTPDAIKNDNIKYEIKNNDAIAASDKKTKEFIDIASEDAAKLLNNKVQGEHNLCEENVNIGDRIKVNENTNEEVNEDNHEDTNPASLPRAEISNNYDDSIIESDLLKTDEDTSQGDIQNGQNSMDLETAAVTIQKVFRSFLCKSRNSTFEDMTNDDTTSFDEDNDKKEEYFAAANINKERRPLGITRMDTVLQTVNEEKSLSLSTDDSSTLSSAATTIQAHVRGFLVRNKLNSYKTVSTNSLVNSNEILDTDLEQQKNKTILNIHIVPEEGNYLSRDESLFTSMDLSLDGSPPSSVNLHPLSYDLSERRKLLKREDAIQSISPPSNNSGKLSEDSVKEVLINENDAAKTESNIVEKQDQSNHDDNSMGTLSAPATAVTILDSPSEQAERERASTERRKMSMIRTSSDESDVITPFIASPRSLGEFDNPSKLVHSGEFHDVVLPTKVSRSDTAVVREFKNVLAYILLWNNS